MTYKYNNTLFADIFLAASATTANNDSVSEYKVNSTAISFHKPQGNTNYFKASYNASTTTLYYSIQSSNLFAKFAPRTTRYDTTGAHTFHINTRRWSILLLAGGGGGEGGVQYSGGNRGGGGGGGASGTWCFAYNSTIFGSLTVTIGAGGVGGANGGDMTTEYQYPGYDENNKKGVDCTAGGNSLISNSTTTLLTVYGGAYAERKRTNGSTGGLGGAVPASAFAKDTSMTVIDSSGGVAGSPGDDDDITTGGVQAQGGTGGVNTVAATIGITIKSESFLNIDTKGNGGNGGRGEGRSGQSGGGIDGSPGEAGLAVIMEYFF